MNPTHDDNPRDWVERMLIKLREGEATPDEVTQLRELLATNAEARRVFVRAKQMDTLLETSPMQPVAMPVVTMPRAKSSLRWKIATLASAAAAMVAMAFLFLGNQANDGRGRNATVAVLHSSFEAVIDGREVLEGEQTMRAGTYKLERGSVGLRFASGAEVVIEGPAAFDLVDAATMHLNQGSLWAHCPEQARGFAVRMPGGRELVDFGTEFGARVDSQGGGQVQVIEGEVKIHDAVAQSLDLTAGKAAGWELTAPPLAMNAAAVKPFQSAMMLKAKVKAAPKVDDRTVVWAMEGGGDWSDAGAWSSGALPGGHSLERAVINQGRVMRVTAGLRSPAHPVDIHVSNGGLPGASGPDGVLEIAGDLECQMLRIATAENAWGVVRHTAGTVNVTDSLLVSSHTEKPALGVYALSDGALQVGHDLHLGELGPAEVSLRGSRARVTAGRLIMEKLATLSFVLDSDGAGLIKLRDTLTRHPQAKLVIDGSQYRGGEKTMPLMLCGSSLKAEGGFSPEQVRFVGFAGATPRLAFRSGGIDLVIEAAR